MCLICAVLALAIASFGGPAAWAQPGNAAEIVSRYGLRAVDPAVPARELRLPDLAGGERALSDFSGRWVVLTFWATWCGPCRSEMPSLERLHVSRQAQGVAVLGVSVDTQANKAESFVSDYGLTFPNLWDGRGKVAEVYRAQTIPLSYLVDPWGKIVGVAVGARDWLALQPMLDELLALPADGEAPTGSYESTADPIELPRSFQPPTAEAVLLDAAPQVGDPFSVEVRVRWAGNFDDYLLHPPRLNLPDPVVQEAQSASTSSADGRNIVTYRIDLRAAEAGSYALNPVELVYTPRDEVEPISSRVEGPTVEVAEATMLGLRPRTLAATGGGVVAAFLGAGAFLRWSRGRRMEPEPARDGVAAELRQRLEAARALRMEGDLRGAVLALTEIEQELGVAEGPDLAALDRRLESARYGGHQPTREELEGIERRVARRVRETEQGPLQAERDALRLRNQET